MSRHILVLMLNLLGKNCADNTLKNMSYLSQKIVFDLSCYCLETICMKGQSLFSVKKKYIKISICCLLILSREWRGLKRYEYTIPPVHQSVQIYKPRNREASPKTVLVLFGPKMD